MSGHPADKASISSGLTYQSTSATYTALVGGGKTRHALEPFGRQWTICGREPSCVDGSAPREITCLMCLKIMAKGTLYAA